MADFVVRNVDGKLYVFPIGPQCEAPDLALGTRCTGRVSTPDEADGCWTSTRVPGFDAPLRVFNVGYGSCANLVLYLCEGHNDDPPDEVTGPPPVRFDLARHRHLIGAQHLEDFWASSSPYYPDRRMAKFAAALYRYWDADDLLLYVGISGQMGYRERSHIKGSSWMDFAARSTIERYPARYQAESAEIAAIESERPLFNSKHNDSPEARQRLVEYLVGHGRTDLLAPAVSRG